MVWLCQATRCSSGSLTRTQSTPNLSLLAKPPSSSIGWKVVSTSSLLKQYHPSAGPCPSRPNLWCYGLIQVCLCLCVRYLVSVSLCPLPGICVSVSVTWYLCLCVRYLVSMSLHVLFGAVETIDTNYKGPRNQLLLLSVLGECAHNICILHC